MANNTMTVRLITRNDTEANWLLKDPVLMLGEMAISTDKGLIKIGDDTHPWSELKYVNDPAAAYSSHYAGSPESSEETDEQIIARVMADKTAKKGDVFIVTRAIYGDKTSYTAYVYTDKWEAMDGNYNSENVYFSEDFTVTSNIGAVTIPEGESNTTVKAAGKNLKDVLASILAKREYPEATPPSVTVKMTTSTSVEVGTKITPTYETTFDAGSYTYGPETGITATSWSVTDGTNTKDTATGTFPEITVTDTTNYNVTATATYSAGAIPVDNLGDEYADGQIEAGSASASVVTKLTGYRAAFIGYLTTTAEEEPLTSDVIRGLQEKIKGYKSAQTKTIKAGENGAKRIVVAYPANTTRGGLSKVELPSTFEGYTVTELYTQQANIDVQGAGTEDNAIPYTVWVYPPVGGVINSDEVHKIFLA